MADSDLFPREPKTEIDLPVAPPTVPVQPLPGSRTVIGTKGQTLVPASAAPAAPVAVADQRRIISGIDLIDFGAGGLYPGKFYLVRGAAGIGKTLVALQFIGRGLQLEEPAIMITSQKPEDVILQARSLGFELSEPARRGQLMILNPSSKYFDLIETPADIAAILQELSDYAAEAGAKRLVIDPVYSLIHTGYSGQFTISVTQTLLNALEELPLTTLLTAATDVAPELSQVSHALEDAAFGVVELFADEATGGRVMNLSKLRYASTETLSAHYRIMEGRGLTNYRAEGARDMWDDAEVAPVRRSVLLLGSSADTIRSVRDALGENFTIASESNIGVGVEQARIMRPGLVLITPNRSHGAVAALVDLARTTDSSIAFLSPSANRQSDKILYLRAGADDFITEPFRPAEFRARVDALIRRSGRRLIARDSGLATLTADDIRMLAGEPETTEARRRELLYTRGTTVEFAPELYERIRRSIETMYKMDAEFALFWLKARSDDREINQILARLCREEDILCRNANGEFVIILMGADADGVVGFERRVAVKLGEQMKMCERGFVIGAAGLTAGQLLERAVRGR
jgi:KaiC/GvpD/RAD55 family RecA-like ATPase/DNA-binding response OmpR family regulator